MPRRLTQVSHQAAVVGCAEDSDELAAGLDLEPLILDLMRAHKKLQAVTLEKPEGRPSSCHP